MDTPAVHERLAAALQARGWQACVVPAEHVAEARATIEGAHAAGLFDQGFYDRTLADLFGWDPPASLPEPRSVILVVRPATINRLTFAWRGEERAVVIPPTYTGYRVAGQEMVAVVAGLLQAGGRHGENAILPQKTLAVRSGLARYGRNNIAYFAGRGSFAQPAALWSDLEALHDPWGEALALERCASCTACLKACPTGAIGEERFLLHTERCLTFLNEDLDPFPDWLDPAAHNALVGCMRCQEVCPEDRAVLGEVDQGPSFSERETELLVAGTPRAGLPAATVAKIDSLHTFMEHELLCRNLAVLFASGGGPARDRTPVRESAPDAGRLGGEASIGFAPREMDPA